MICRASATYRDDLFAELVIDNFAGGGGAGLGIELALGRPTDHAINHDAEAIAMHRVNHPGTEHHHSDVWEVDPLEVTQGRPVGLAWFSPDCKHFSKAKGGKPVSKRVRGLAWVVVKWAKAVRPRVIMLENVEEFQTWGPLTPEGLPCPRRKGDTFRGWKRELQKLDYEVEHRELRACDYGAPTIRKRLFLIARCDGQPIIWPEVTHGEVLNESVDDPCTLRKRAIRAQDIHPPEPTAQRIDAAALPDQRGRASRKTNAAPTGTGPRGVLQGNRRGRHLKPYRTAAECIDWSIPCPSIFERKRPLADNTLKRIAAGIKRYVLDNPRPFLVSIANYGGWGAPAHSIDDPLTTITANPRGGHHAVCVPTLVQTGYGERKGQAPRVPGLDKPLGTVVAGGGKHALVAAFLAQHNSERGNGVKAGRPATEPMSTVTTSGSHQGIVAAHLTHLYGSNTGNGGDLDQPIGTVTASGNHAGLVAALLIKYYGEGGQWSACDEPMGTITTKERMGLVTVEIDGETYIITDIGMRMLQPRELYRAQGFGDDYVIDYGLDEHGERIDFTKTAQVRMCGNSVSPTCAEALVRANYPTGRMADLRRLGNLAAVGGSA